MNNNEFSDVDKNFDEVHIANADVDPTQKSNRKKVNKIANFIAVIIIVFFVSIPLLAFGVVVMQLNSIVANSFDESYDVLDMVYRLMGVTSREVEISNALIDQAGEKSHEQVELLLENVIYSNDQYINEVVVEFESNGYINLNDIMHLQTLIKENTKYMITHTKNDDGYIKIIYIDEINN